MSKQEKYIKVKLENDDDGHWYVIPNHLHKKFNADLEKGDFDHFADEYSDYMTGGDLNSVQLYAKDIGLPSPESAYKERLDIITKVLGFVAKQENNINKSDLIDYLRIMVDEIAEG